MSTEHDELLSELAQNRAFEVLERQERLRNAQTINNNNQAAADLHHSTSELNIAKAKFWCSLRAVVLTTWAAAIAAGCFWVIYHIVR